MAGIFVGFVGHTSEAGIGYYACDACLRQSDISFWAALLTVAAIALTLMVAFTAWILFDFLQLVVRGFVGA